MSSSRTYKSLGNAGVIYTPFSFFIPKILWFRISHFDFTNVICLRILKNGDIISGSYDHTAKIWKKGKDNPEATLEGHEFTVFDISECKNGNILTASGDGTIKLWDIKTKKCIQTFIGHSDYVVSLHSTKGNVFISGSYDNTAIIWTIKY